MDMKTKKKKEEVKPDLELKFELAALLKAKAPGIFEREPNAGFVGTALAKLVEDIINLMKK